MSSATSTSADAEVRSPSSSVKADSTFRASHFFTLSSLLAATVAVVMARQSTPEHLVLTSLTIGAAGLAAAGFYRVLSPLVGADLTEGSREPVSQRARAVIEREKLLTLRALKDLEFDRSMAKVSQADFDEMANRLRTRALALMKQLDEDSSGYRTLIERELSARLAAKPAVVPTTAVPLADVHAAPAGVCTCGTPNDPDAVFCKRCGTKLVA